MGAPNILYALCQFPPNVLRKNVDSHQMFSFHHMLLAFSYLKALNSILVNMLGD